MHLIPVAVFLVLPIDWIEAQKPPNIWQLSEKPVLSIGSRDGKGPEQFGSVAGAVRLSLGAVLVADGMSLERRLFSPTGIPLKTAGRRGAGPGEFRTVKSIRRCADDSTFVYDPALARLSVFSPTGAYTRAIDVRTWSTSGLPPYDFWCNSGGTLAFVHRSSAPPPGIGPRRPDVAITVLARNGSVINLGTFPASERYFSGSEDFPRPLGKQTSVGMGANAAYVGTSDAFEVTEFSLHGERLGTLRETRAQVLVTAAHVSKYIKEQIGRRRGRLDTKALERLYRELQYPSAFPAYANLMVDAIDKLWIEGYPIPGKDRREWWIYSKSGVATAVMWVPSNLQLLEAGRDYVLGVWRDEFDVEYIRVYSLVK